MATWLTGPFVAFDLETTGVDRFRDVPVSYALVHILEGDVFDCDTRIINPNRPIPEEAARIHGITTEMAEKDGMPLDDAVVHIAGVLAECSSNNVPVVGMNLDYDLTMLDVHCKKMGNSLQERGFDANVLDVLVIDRHVDKFRKGKRKLENLCEHYGVELSNAHNATADAEGSLRVFLAMCRAHPDLIALGADGIFREEVAWHHEWATSYSSWRKDRGMEPLSDEEFSWPIATKGGA